MEVRVIDRVGHRGIVFIELAICAQQQAPRAQCKADIGAITQTVTACLVLAGHHGPGRVAQAVVIHLVIDIIIEHLAVYIVSTKRTTVLGFKNIGVDEVDVHR